MGEEVQDKHQNLWKLLLLIGAVYFFLNYICPLVSPFLLAAIFVTIFGPIFLKLQRRFHLKRQVSAILFLCVVVGFLLLVVWLLLSWTINSLPDWINGLVSLENTMERSLDQCCSKLESLFSIDGEFLRTIVASALDNAVTYLQNSALADVISHGLDYAKQIGKIGAFLVVFLIASVLLAKDYDTIVTKMLDTEECHIILEVLCGVIRYIAVYVRAQMLLLSLIGGSCALGLSLVRVENGLFYGLLAGVLDALPFIGTGIVLLPLSIYHLVTKQFLKATITVVLYVLCIFLREILEPKLIGDKVGIPPLAILFSLFVGIGLFGVSGILKGPLGYLLIKLIYESKYGTLFLGKVEENKG